MRLYVFYAVLLGIALLPAITRADTCHDKTAALFDNGPLDPFIQPAHAIERKIVSENLMVVDTYIIVNDTPDRAMIGLRGQSMDLYIEGRKWTGPGMDGPWSESSEQMSWDMPAYIRATTDQMAANLSDTRCYGAVPHKGRPHLKYIFTTQTDPDAERDGIYYGGTYTVLIDEETGRLSRRVQRAMFIGDQFAPGTETWFEDYTYDPSYRLTAPD